jgi:DNA (cytosine-5)-methyltransferase 1
MTHGSLFSGIGGFDLAAEWMGWENKFHCEWNPFGQKVLKHYWPEAESFNDITKTNFTKYEKKIDVLTGGFPCQPYSMAGKRKGKEDSRHLWPEMCRAIQEIKPRWIVGENVYGLVNWSGGLVFHEVQADLEAAGYEVQPYLLPAAAVNAPHRRDRIWFIAHATRFNDRTNKYGSIRFEDAKISGQRTQTIYDAIDTNGYSGISSNTDNNGFNQCDSKYEIKSSKGGLNAFNDFGKICSWERFPTVPPICDGNDGIPNRLDGITFPKWRRESIKAGGNAIVPQVALQIFKTIEQYEKNRADN